jgi:LAS superfamily LD-carboxypeptidase LdcB
MTADSLDSLELTGRARTHVVQRDDLKAALHPAALNAFLAMKDEAARDGFDIAITSAFRDFEAQQRIWNLKFRGERPLFDPEGRARDHASLAPGELIEAILCWSALPGASRHHWGSEVDLIDRAAVPTGYRVQLVPSEAAEGGMFHPLHCWLDAHMARFGFFRPYASFRGGVLPEAWHLSYAPVSVPALDALTCELLEEAVRSSDMLGRDLLLPRIDEIYARYVINIDAPPHSGAAVAAR